MVPRQSELSEVSCDSLRHGCQYTFIVFVILILIRYVDSAFILLKGTSPQ